MMDKCNPMDIKIYTKDYCSYCVRAKSLLTSLGYPYEEIDITDTPEKLRELAEITRMRTVPQIFVDGVCIGGYDELSGLVRSGAFPPDR